MTPARIVPAINRLSVAALAAGLCACSPSFPPIATGLRGDAAFKAEVATFHPPGSSGRVLRDELIREEFTVVSDATGRRYTATFRPDNLPCYSVTRIEWTEDRRGRIAEITAERHDCS